MIASLPRASNSPSTSTACFLVTSSFAQFSPATADALKGGGRMNGIGAMGNAGQTMYAASKSALVGMMRSIAREYGSRGVTANVVSPGYIETDMTAGMTDEMRKKLIEMTPTGRIGRPDDVASAVVYLASAEAAWVTGQVLDVNGGLRM